MWSCAFSASTTLVESLRERFRSFTGAVAYTH
jgi:hypothetical protein